MRAVTAEEMAEMDRTAIEDVGIPGVVLMENAGRGATEIMWRYYPGLDGKRVVVLAGGGNNGGDGFVIARHLWQQDVEVAVCCLKTFESYRGDAKINLEIIQKLGLFVEEFTDSSRLAALRRRAEDADLLVDAIFGTGLNAQVRGFFREVIDLVNSFRKPVLAVDLPSGLNASSGLPLGTCIQASVTATFGLPKVGQLVTPGCSYVGHLEVVDIGLPRDLFETEDPPRIWLEASDLAPLVHPRPCASHKGTFGHVLVVGGSVGKTGAGAMAGLGAARAGAGLVTLAVPASLHGFMEMKLTEVMTEPLPETAEQTVATTALPRLTALLADKQALALGPGLSVQEETTQVVLRLLEDCPCPILLDADALNGLAGHLEVLGRAKAPIILTPHPGEMGRLLGCSGAEVQNQRLAAVQSFSREYAVTVVLKGARSLISSPKGRLGINSSGNPGLASGGTGDVLSGLIAGFLAQGLSPFDAACLGVYCHGKAADRLAVRWGDRGMLATDLLEEIPVVLNALAEQGS
ncbi:MAG: NAD(P)H-hydrate dehydratase [Deltaproteobacteria bacterium]|nr:MAG: NAD(P)H-hydrate dehydratase [Deltaproteobacteria bacterium]